MSKVITLRLADDEYKQIAAQAELEHRPISNYITAHVLKDIERSYFVDGIEMDQIREDKELYNKLSQGHEDAENMKGKFVE